MLRDQQKHWLNTEHPYRTPFLATLLGVVADLSSDRAVRIGELLAERPDGGFRYFAGLSLWGHYLHATVLRQTGLRRLAEKIKETRIGVDLVDRSPRLEVSWEGAWKVLGIDLLPGWHLPETHALNREAAMAVMAEEPYRGHEALMCLVTPKLVPGTRDLKQHLSEANKDWLLRILRERSPNITDPLTQEIIPHLLRRHDVLPSDLYFRPILALCRFAIMEGHISTDLPGWFEEEGLLERVKALSEILRDPDYFDHPALLELAEAHLERRESHPLSLDWKDSFPYLFPFEGADNSPEVRKYVVTNIKNMHHLREYLDSRSSTNVPRPTAGCLRLDGKDNTTLAAHISELMQQENAYGYFKWIVHSPQWLPHINRPLRKVTGLQGLYLGHVIKDHNVHAETIQRHSPGFVKGQHCFDGGTINIDTKDGRLTIKVEADATTLGTIHYPKPVQVALIQYVVGVLGLTDSPYLIK